MSNVYRIFLSLPMHGKSMDKISEMVEKAKKTIRDFKMTKPTKYAQPEVKYLYDALNKYDEYEVVCTCDFPNLDEDIIRKANEPRIKYLARAINTLGDCNVAMFCPGWISAAGCNVEFTVCKLYYIPTFELYSPSKSADNEYCIKGLKG